VKLNPFDVLEGNKIDVSDVEFLNEDLAPDFLEETLKELDMVV